MDQAMDPGQPMQKCHCPHHKVLPLFILLFGLLFLLNALAVIPDRATSIIWPIIVILGGLQKMFGHRCSCCHRM